MEEILGILFGVIVVFGAWWWATRVPLSSHEMWWYRHIHGMDEDQADTFRKGCVVGFAILFVGMLLLKAFGHLLSVHF